MNINIPLIRISVFLGLIISETFVSAPSMALKVGETLLPTELAKSWSMSHDMLAGKFSITNFLKISQIFASPITTPSASSSEVIAQGIRDVPPGEGRTKTPST